MFQRKVTAVLSKEVYFQTHLQPNHELGILPCELAIFPRKLEFEITSFETEKYKQRTMDSHCVF
jgi:hypothetical protein